MISTTIDQEIKKAMLAKNNAQLRGLRAIKAALLLAKTEKGSAEEITEETELKILQKLIKQRRESADIYKQQNREDLYQVEEEEIEVINQFLPKQLDRAEVAVIIETVIKQSGATSVKQELAGRIQTFLRESMPQWRARYPGVEAMHVAVMGCVVNGPGESKLANIGISLPGTGETPVAPVFVDGRKTVTLKGERIAEEFEQIVVDYVRATYGGEARSSSLLPQHKTTADTTDTGAIGAHR